jgi:hypothetical protein
MLLSYFSGKREERYDACRPQPEKAKAELVFQRSLDATSGGSDERHEKRALRVREEAF